MTLYSAPRVTTGDNLVGLWRPSLTRVGHKVYVFGGGGHVTTELHSLDLLSSVWNTELTKGQPPTKRYGHSASLYRDWIIIFGGSNEYQEYCNDVVIYDLTKRQWFRPNVTGRNISARYLHSAVAYGSKLYIYGGFARNAEMTYVLEELAVLDLEKFTWDIVSTAVPARYNHTATLIGHKMYIYAGKDESGSTVSDIFYLDLDNAKVVTLVEVSGEVVLLKSQHFAEAVDGNIVVFGKYLPTQIPTSSMAPQPNGLWQLDLQHLVWRRLEGAKQFTKGGVWNYFTVLDMDQTPSTKFSSEDDMQISRCNGASDNHGPTEGIHLVFLGNTDFERQPPYDHFRDIISVDIESLGMFSMPKSDFAMELGGYLDNPTLSDFIIIADEEKPIHVHKMILAARWPHFRNIFNSGMIESTSNQMKIPEPRDVVHAFLYYLYTDRIPENAPWHVVTDVLILAGLYFLPRLRKLCSHRLIARHINPETCARLFETAVVAQEQGLKVRVLKYIFENYGPVLKSQCLDSLPSPIHEEFVACVPSNASLTFGNGSCHPPMSSDRDATVVTTSK